MSSALAQLDALVFNGIKDFPAVQTLVPGGKVQVFDRGVDIRGDIASNAALGMRIQIERVRSQKNFYATSGEVKYERRYAVRLGTGTPQAAPCTDLEWAIDGAVRNMIDRKTADGQTLIVPAPFRLESIAETESDPHRDKYFDEIEELADMLDIVLVAFCDRARVGT